MSKNESMTTEYALTVYRNDANTGIFHIGPDTGELIRKAQESVSMVFGNGKHVSRVCKAKDGLAGKLVTADGLNYRYEIEMFAA